MKADADVKDVSSWTQEVKISVNICLPFLEEKWREMFMIFQTERAWMTLIDEGKWVCKNELNVTNSHTETFPLKQKAFNFYVKIFHGKLKNILFLIFLFQENSFCRGKCQSEALKYFNEEKKFRQKLPSKQAAVFFLLRTAKMIWDFGSWDRWKFIRDFKNLFLMW